MSLTILNVAYPLVPIGADTVGGAEQFVATLDREIERAGHHSLVLAAEGSRTRGDLIASPGWNGSIDEQVREWAAREHARLLSAALVKFEIDAVHLHGLDFFDYLPREEVPCIATLHLPPEWYPPEIFGLKRPRTVYVCVSHDQYRRLKPGIVAIRTIPHGIDIGSFSAEETHGKYAVALGRICPEKGFHFAIDAAERAEVPLVLAGRIYPYAAHETYFRDEIAPRLNRRVRFVGPAGLREKRTLLSRARCVLIPSTVAETSSLVAMEAMASGTPVVAFPSGALKEIVEPGQTGFLVNDSAEMAEAILASGRISRGKCRRAAEARFNVSRMIKEYLELYAEVSEGVRFMTPRGRAVK